MSPRNFCYLVHVPTGPGGVATVTLCGRPVDHVAHTSAAEAVTCPECQRHGRNLEQWARQMCGRTWTVEGIRSTCAHQRGHGGTHADPSTGAVWADGATP